MCGKEKLMQNAESAISTAANPVSAAAAAAASLSPLSVEAQYQIPPSVDGKPECSHAIQSLYNACKSTFSRIQGPFSADGLDMVRSLLDNIKPSDIGLDEAFITERFRNGYTMKRTGSQQGKVTPPISYIHIYECEYFTMAVFCLPPTAVIPLHNHPGMTVLSKLLYGSMHVKAYDWSENLTLSRSGSSHSRLAKLVTDKVMKFPCESTILYPTSGGNIHSFTAVTSCAVLDILAPPYNKEDRHCTYYKASSCSPQSGAFTKYKKKNTREDYAWLEDIEQPASCIVQPVSYRGPKIIL